jgi:hypothetical protein
MAVSIDAPRSRAGPPSVQDQVRKAFAKLGRWWLREFRAAVPSPLLAAFDTDRMSMLVIAPSDVEVTATLQDRTGRLAFQHTVSWSDYTPNCLRDWTAAAAAHEPSHELVLRLPNADAIQGKLTLPVEAEPRIEAIVREQILRKTPFDLDRVLIGYTAFAVDGHRVEARYLLVPKQRLEPRLDRLGLTQDRLAAIIGSGDDVWLAPRIRLRPDPQRTLRLSTRMTSLLAAACVGCVGLGLGYTLWRQQVLLQDVERRTEAIAGPARSIVGRLNDIRDVNGQIADLIAARSTPKIVHIWEELALLLPSTTYLTAVDVRGQDLQMSGISATSAELIRILERSSMFSTVELAGPVTVDRASGREQFSLRAKLRKPRLLSDSSQ